MTVKLLTTINRTDRLLKSLKNVRDANFNPEVFYALDADTPFQSFNKSMMHIMHNTEGTLLLFEDDVDIRCFEHFDKAISQLPDDWELCYLGANLVEPVEKYSENLYKVQGAWTTHAVMYNNPKTLLADYNDINFMFDDWLRRNINPRGKSFIISPMMAWQMPSESDLWNHYADYRQIFDGSASKLI